MWDFIKRLFGIKPKDIPVMSQGGEIWSAQKQAAREAVQEAIDNAADVAEQEVAAVVEPEITAPAKRKKRTPAKKTPAKKPAPKKSK